MPIAEYRAAAAWSYDRKKAAAIEKILDEGWAIKRACAWYGMGSKAFSRHLRNERIKRGLPPTKREELALADEASRRQMQKQAMDEEGKLAGDSKGTNVLSQHLDPDFVARPDFVTRRRIPPPDEFNRIYFGHFICPDCDEKHPNPDFHSELTALCQDDDVRRAVILTPPYHAKTTVVTVRDTVYDICKDPNSRTLIISETRDFAQNILGGIKSLLDDPSMYAGAERNLIEDWGPFYEPGQIWNREGIVVTGRQTSEIDPTVQVLGYRGQIYGRRADKIKSDDIASYHNQANPDQVTSMLDWFDSQVLSRIGRKARMMWVGTRVRPTDIYASLIQRDGYHVMRYPAILDEKAGKTLWPEHFPYDFACIRRGEMDAAMFELVYQNVEVLTTGTSFPHEFLEEAKDEDRGVGEFDSGWFLFGGLDPAGAGTDSGYTAFVIMAVDPHTNHYYVVDAYREKRMKAPDMRDKMLELSDRYSLYAWVCEVNGVQRQLTQYNEEIAVPLAARGIPIIPHVTNQNKWDEQFGIESMIPLFTNGLMTIPWRGRNEHIEQLVNEVRMFPYGAITDLLMAMWFTVIGCREVTNRPTMPLFDKRTKAWPSRIRKNRKLLNFNEGTVTPIPIHAQDSRLWGEHRRRQAVGVPTMYPDIMEEADKPPVLVPYMNREGHVNASDNGSADTA